MLVRRESIQPLLDASGVVPPVDITEQRGIGLLTGGPGVAVDQLNLDRGPKVLGKGVVEAVADAAGGWRDLGIGQALGEANRRVLAALDALLCVKGSERGRFRPPHIDVDRASPGPRQGRCRAAARSACGRSLTRPRPREIDQLPEAGKNGHLS